METHSALLDIQGEDQIPVDANHQQICKFEGRENAVYDKLIRRVRRIRNSSTNQAPQATSSTSGILLLEAPNPRPTALAPDFQDGLYTPRRSLPTELHDPVNLPR